MRRRLASLLLLAAACIIPDRNIAAEKVEGNPGAVRIVEATTLPRLFIDDCIDGDSTRCPQVPTTRRTGLVQYTELDDMGREVVRPLCVCPVGASDLRTIDEFYLYAEDPDGAQADRDERLYAVALLDLDPLTDAPQNFVAYRDHFEVGGEGEPFTLDELPVSELAAVDRSPDNESLLSPSLGREETQLYRFRFGKNGGNGTDLCNDDNGTKLSAGVHSLQIMVTDRPFFRPPLLDDDGEPVLGIDGRPLLAPPQPGMPDIANGATWAIANYVFECLLEEADVPDDDSVCECSEVIGP